MENFDNSEAINNRIAQIIRHYGLSASSFSKKIGISSTIIGNIVGGRRSKPSIEAIQAIYSSFEDINLEWLIAGEGDIIKEKGSSLAEPEASYKRIILDNQVQFLNEHIKELTEVIKNLSKK